MERPALKAVLTAEEREIIIQVLSTANFSGDAAALNQILALIQSIVDKLSNPFSDDSHQ